MKKIIVLALTFIIAVSFMPVLETHCDNGDDKIYISKTGDLWNDYVNMMNIVFPGGTVSA